MRSLWMLACSSLFFGVTSVEALPPHPSADRLDADPIASEELAGGGLGRHRSSERAQRVERGADWCRHGGAALVGTPLLDGADRVYFATSDGYLHAYEADGRYRFSYTVSGAPLGRPSRREVDGAILLGTTSSLIYAIHPNGSLVWQRATLSPVWSGLYPLEGTTVVHLGLDRQLYALSDRGIRLYRVPLPGRPVGEPVVAPGGVVWVPLDTGLGRMERAVRVTRAPFSSPVEQVEWFDTDALALSSGQLTRVRLDERVEELGAATSLGSDGHVAAWLDASSRGRVRGPDFERPFVSVLEASGPLAVGRGLIVVPGADGRAEIHTARRSDAPTTLEVARAPLARLVLGARLLVAATHSGAVCAVTLPARFRRAD